MSVSWLQKTLDAWIFDPNSKNSIPDEVSDFIMFLKTHSMSSEKREIDAILKKWDEDMWEALNAVATAKPSANLKLIYAKNMINSISDPKARERQLAKLPDRIRNELVKDKIQRNLMVWSSKNGIQTMPTAKELRTFQAYIQEEFSRSTMSPQEKLNFLMTPISSGRLV